MSQIELTILMPCLNEAETLALCIQKAKSFLTKSRIHGEILIADNGSLDGSQEIAVREGARVIDVPVRGYGSALISGVQHALGRFVIMGDADDSYDFSDLSAFMGKLRDNYELVMGNRFKGKIEHGAMPFLNKYLGNPVLSFLGQIFYRSGIGDFHCGLRGFNKDAIKKLNLQSSGMEFASEMVVKATLHKLKITEVPTTLSQDGRSRRPHLRPWRDGWRHLRLLLLLSPKWLFLYPGLFLLAFGLILLTSLVGGPLKIQQYVFDIHTMLFGSAFTIVGVQAVLFFVCARLISTLDIRVYSSPSVKIPRYFEIFNLERGIIAGGGCVGFGIAGCFYAFMTWMQHQFGPLMPTQEMRVLIPAFTSLLVGMQIIFSSFFLSILGVYFKPATHLPS